MKIDINNQELYKILVDEFGEADFRVFFVENDAGRELRTGKKLYEDKVAPTSRSMYVGVSKELCLIPDCNNLNQ